MAAACALTIALSAPVAHSPVLDSDLSDWCLDSAPRIENRALELTCPFGNETVWWDAPADAIVNDLAAAAVTQDSIGLYWAIQWHLYFDPISLPLVEIAIDVGPGGNNRWWDPLNAVGTPGHCSVDTDRLCTVDADCHFCAVTKDYAGTPHERPSVCGSTDALDNCGDFDPTDLCLRDQSCQGLGSGPLVSFAGALSEPATIPDYLLVIDFGRWLLGACDSVNLLRNDNGNWAEIPRPVPDPACPSPTWKFALASPPPGTGDPLPLPIGVELGLPWLAFNCVGCLPFGPGDDFRWTVAVTRGLLTLDYRPSGPVEDLPSEATAGTTTTSPNSCMAPGTATTLCEVADGSADAFVPIAARPAGGEIEQLTLRRNDSGTPTPSITLTWDPSCSNGDTDYAVYEGDIGAWYDHGPPASGPLCGTGGGIAATFQAGAGDQYYLVVPRDDLVEGSYGRNGSGQERPAGMAPCAAQSLGGCSTVPLPLE